MNRGICVSATKKEFEYDLNLQTDYSPSVKFHDSPMVQDENGNLVRAPKIEKF